VTTMRSAEATSGVSASFQLATGKPEVEFGILNQFQSADRSKPCGIEFSFCVFECPTSKSTP
jgi:hypothetical protein